MKKHDLFQLIILGIGAWAAFQCFMLVCALVIYIIKLAMDDFRIESTQQHLISNAIMTVGYFVVAHFALRRTEQVIEFLKPDATKNISGLSEENEPAEQLPLISKADILRIILIGIALIVMIPQIPMFIQSVYHAFQSKLNPMEYNFDVLFFLGSVLAVLIPALLIIFSRRIVSLFKFN